MGLKRVFGNAAGHIPGQDGTLADHGYHFTDALQHFIIITKIFYGET